MAVKWTEDLSVGVGVIDTQHKELFAMADALLEGVGRGEGHGEVTKTVAFLRSTWRTTSEWKRCT